MSQFFNSYIFKFSVISIFFIVSMYFVVSGLPGISTFVFSILGAWKAGEWVVWIAEKLTKMIHTEKNDN